MHGATIKKYKQLFYRRSRATEELRDGSIY
jgi:hypothetical protein